MRNVSKTFPGVKALQKVELTVYPGEVHALMGENGAGKSTLMKILSGAYIPDPGAEILIDDKPVHINGPLSAKEHGIAIIYQELALAPNLTVAENIYLGREAQRGPTIDRAGMIAGCADILTNLGATFGPRTVVGDLSIAEQQMVEVARAIHARSRILVMDEPTTALSSRETQRLFQVILRLKAEGLAIIYISHRMAEVYELSERVTVLRDGGYVGTLSREEVRPESIVRMMVGRDLSSFYKKEHRPGFAGKPVLEVTDLADGHRVKRGSFTLHEGEVLGLAGLVGAGRTELARLIYGAEPAPRGVVKLLGKPVNYPTPAEAIDGGVVYLTEDRKAQGLFLDMTVGDNINLGRHRPRCEGRRLARPRPCADPLAGGNQGNEHPRPRPGNNSRYPLRREPAEGAAVAPAGDPAEVLILDEPTRGVDIGAKSEIYRIIDELAQIRRRGAGHQFGTAGGRWDRRPRRGDA